MVDGVSRRWDLKVKKNDANPIIVSVVMPIYNEEKYIKKCIDSLFKQSFPRKKWNGFSLMVCQKIRQNP